MRLGRRPRPVDARTEILRRIRTAIDDGAGGRVAVAPPRRRYRQGGELTPGSPELLELLVDRLVDYRAVVHRAEDADDVPRALARLLDGAESVVLPSWLDAAWITAVAATGVRLLTDDPTVPLTPQVLDKAGVVVTGARVAIAETGTIVLDAARDQGRRMITLMPDRHLCILRADQVVQTVPEAIRILEQAPARPQTWISGPSATSDIELTRVEGVHGPRRLEVLLVERS